MIRFLTIFAQCENVHLTKDVGMVPYILHKHYGYKATLASYKNGSYPYLHSEVKGLKQVFIKRRFKLELFNVLTFLLFNAKNYDALQVYHFSARSLIYLSFFKAIKLFGTSKTYLKLDADEGILTLTLKGLQGWVLRKLLLKIDVVSIECKQLYDQLRLNPLWNTNLVYMPNGFYEEQGESISYYGKQNVILTVGRIGSHQKNNEALVEAFCHLAKKYPSWNLELVGPVELSFVKYIEEVLLQYPFLLGRILVKGAIEDRQELKLIYQKAKVFALTSRYEGFPLVFLEAMRAGCTILSSNIPAAYDIIGSNKYGQVYDRDNVADLIKALELLIANEPLLESNCDLIQERAYQHFFWPILLDVIHKRLNK